MTEIKRKPYNLEERTLDFSKEIINFCKKLPKDIFNNKLIDQLVAASTSVGANYREANEALSKKDFIHRMRITRKECKETSYWLELLKEGNPIVQKDIEILFKESQELRNIFTSIIEKMK